MKVRLERGMEWIGRSELWVEGGLLRMGWGNGVAKGARPTLFNSTVLSLLAYYFPCSSRCQRLAGWLAGCREGGRAEQLASSLCSFVLQRLSSLPVLHCTLPLAARL